MIAIAFIAFGAAWMYIRKDVGGGKLGIYAPGTKPAAA
jgi:hypothetical protein